MVMKRLMSSHVSFAQVPPLPTYKIINVTRAMPVQIKRDRKLVHFFLCLRRSFIQYTSKVYTNVLDEL